MKKRLVAIAAVITGLALAGPVAPASAAALTSSAVSGIQFWYPAPLFKPTQFTVGSSLSVQACFSGPTSATAGNLNLLKLALNNGSLLSTDGAFTPAMSNCLVFSKTIAGTDASIGQARVAALQIPVGTTLQVGLDSTAGAASIDMTTVGGAFLAPLGQGTPVIAKPVWNPFSPEHTSSPGNSVPPIPRNDVLSVILLGADRVNAVSGAIKVFKQNGNVGAVGGDPADTEVESISLLAQTTFPIQTGVEQDPRISFQIGSVMTLPNAGPVLQLFVDPFLDFDATSAYYLTVEAGAFGTATLNNAAVAAGAYRFTTGTTFATPPLPTGPSVYEVSTTQASGYYKNGQAPFNITVKFSSAISATAPKLKLNVVSGGFVIDCTLGVDNVTLTCPYTVGVGHNSVNPFGSGTNKDSFKYLNVNDDFVSLLGTFSPPGGSPAGTVVSTVLPVFNTNSLAAKRIVIDNTAPVINGSNPPLNMGGMDFPVTIARNASLLVFAQPDVLFLQPEKSVTVTEFVGSAVHSTITSSSEKSITASARSGSTVTLTSEGHGITVGSTISVRGLTETSFNGWFVVTAVDDDTLTYTTSTSGNVANGGTSGVAVAVPAGQLMFNSSSGILTINPTADFVGPNIAVTAASRATDGVITYTASQAHGIPNGPVATTAATWSSNVVTVTAAGHGLRKGDRVEIGGLDTALNGTKIVTSVAGNNFTYALSGDDPVSDAVGTVTQRIIVTNAGPNFNTAADGCIVTGSTSSTPHQFTCASLVVDSPLAVTFTSPMVAFAGAQPQTTYYATVEAGLLRDRAGNVTAGITTVPTSQAPPTVNSWMFKSGVDTFGPQLVGSNVQQACGGTCFPNTQPAVVQFDEVVVEAVDGSDITITPPLPASGTLALAVSGTGATLTASGGFAQSTTYQIVIPANRITDGSGNQMSGPLTLNFTTSSPAAPTFGGGGGVIGGTCGPPPLPPCNVGPGINFGPGGMIQNPGAIVGGDMANLRPDNFMGFRPDDARNLGAGAMQNFRPDQFGALPPTAMAGFNRDQIANLNPAAMAGMNQTQFRALPPEAMGGFRPDQMAQLPPEAMGAFDPTRVQALPPSAMAGFNANQFAQLPPAAMAGFDPTRMQQLPPAAMAGFNANQMQQLPPAAMAGFNANQFAQLPPAAMAGFDPTKMQQLPPAAMAGFKADQMAQLPPAAFTAFDPSKMQQLPPQAMAGFDATRMAQVPPTAMSGFNSNQFAQLPPAAMAAFDPSKMQQLPPAAVAGFNPDQMRALPPEAMRVFDPSKMQQLPPAAMAGFDPTKMQALPPTAMAVMNPNQLGQMPPTAFAAIAPQQFNVLPPTAMQGFKAALMAALPPQMVQNFKPEQFAALPPAAMGGLNEDRFRALPPQAMTAFNPQQMGAVPPQAMEAMRVAQFNVIPPAAMQGFRPEQFSALPPDAMQAFKPTQMAALPPQALAGMEPEQLRVLPPTAARALNPQQMLAVPPQALAAIPPGVFKALTPAAIAALSPEQRSAMPPQAFNPPPLGQPATAANIGNLVNNLSGWNIDKVPPAAFGGMRSTDVAKLPPDAFSAMSPNQVGALPAAAFTAMKPNQVELLPPEAMASMKPTQLGHLPPQVMAAMSPAQIGSLPPAALTQMKPTQAGQLPAEAFEVMKPTQVAALPPAAVGGLKPDQVAALPPEAMTTMKPTQVAALKPTAMAALEPAQVAALPPTALTQMKPTQVAALPVDALAEMKPTQVAALPPAAVGGLKPDQVAALPPEAMTTMKANQVAELKPTAMAALEPAQIDALPPQAFAAVKPAQVGALPVDAVKALEPAQINAMPSAAFAGFKPEQAQQLSPEQAAQIKGPDLAAMSPAVRTIVNDIKS